jgi:hypothetical protein
MQWLLSIFNTSPKPSLSDFKAAGCIFTDGNYVLAGYQPKADYNISGFGGNRIGNETYIQTALRETLEELFEIKPPEYLISHLEKTLTPVYIHLNGSYVLVQYTFEDLVKLLDHSKPIRKQTFIYDTFPESLSDLIFNRKYTVCSEVQQLCLLPFKSNIKIHDGFKLDIDILKRVRIV